MALNIPTEGTKLNELKINIVDTQETFEAMKTANKINANELYFIEQESSIAADSLKTGHTFKVNLASNNASSPFTGEQDISDIGVSGTLPITHGGTGATSAASTPWVQKSGDTMTGVLTMKGNMYNDAYDGALNMNNSDIYGLNSIYTGDTSDGAAEGIHFYRDATHVDTFWVSGGDLLFVPNRAIGTNTTKANSQKISRFTANPTSGQVVVTDGTTGGVKSSGYTIAKSVPSDAKFTDTTYSAGTGISLSGTTFSNSGVRATTINGNYLRVNTNGTDADLTIPYATKAEQDANGCIIPSTYVKLVAGTSIPASSSSHADLNAIDWQKTGSYTVSVSANVPYVDNMPSDYSSTLNGNHAFTLYVYSPLSSDGTTTSGNWIYRIQEIIPYNNHIYRWRRLNYTDGSGTWFFGNWTRQVLSDNNTITTVTTSGNGNAITAISASNGAITATKGSTFLTSHQDISGKADKSATVSTLAWDSTNKKITKTINGTTSDVVSFAAGSNVTLTGASGQLTIATTDNDTKNTAGSTDTSSKIYLIGATSQAANPQTYSDNEVFATSGVLTAKKFNSTSLTASQAVSTDANKNLVSTNLTVSDPTASGTGITYIASVSQSATGKISATKSTVRSASTSQTGVTQYTADNLNTWINQLTTGSSTPTDADYYISQYVGGGSSTTTYHRRPMSALWTYIKGKITAGTYWANIKISDAAAYNATPEMATLKLNGNTGATTASTSNVSLIYNSTTNALDFVFA